MGGRQARGGDPRGAGAGFGRVLAVLGLNATGFAFLETSILPALPLIQRQLGAGSATSTALLESAYLGLAAVAAPLLGRLGDRSGKKGPLLLALAIYLFGAVNAGFSSNIWMLIGFRALQGAGGAVLALSFAILRDRAPDRGSVGTGIGIIVGAFGAGIAAGFGLSDVIATGLSWRWVFWFGSMVVLVNALLVWWLVPSCPPHEGARVDVWGAILLGLAITALISATAFGQPAGWASWYIIELFVLAALLGVVWIAFERRREQPLLDVHVLESPRVLLPNLGALLSGYAAFSVYVTVPRFVHAPRGLPPEAAARLSYGLGVPEALLGLVLMPAGVGVLCGGPLGGWIGRRWTGKWPFVGGLATLSASALLLTLVHDDVLAILFWMFLVGFGFGASVGASATFVAEAVPPGRVGAATAFNTLMRLVGGGVGTQVASAMFVAGRLPGVDAPVAGEGTYVAVFWLAFGLSALGAGLALFVPRGEKGKQ